jgi:putative ABC transport system permease protein
MPAGVALRSAEKDARGQQKLKLIDGRWFATGQREVVVGKSIHDRFSGTQVGDNLDFAKGQWKVVGIFDSGGTAYDSEIWGDFNQVAADFDRQGGLGSAYLRATDPVAADALKNRVSDDQRLKLEGHLETEYYEKQTSSGGAIKYIGFLVAIIMAVGSSFAAMNTMYAAVAYRAREIATLRVIGFSRPSILTSFVLEALLLSLLGAFVGIVLMLPFNGMSTGIGNQVTFSETVFSLQMTWSVVVTAVIFALVMGLLGGFFPAWSAARQEILASLRG